MLQVSVNACELNNKSFLMKHSVAVFNLRILLTGIKASYKSLKQERIQGLKRPWLFKLYKTSRTARICSCRIQYFIQHFLFNIGSAGFSVWYLLFLEQRPHFGCNTFSIFASVLKVRKQSYWEHSVRKTDQNISTSMPFDASTSGTINRKAGSRKWNGR